MKKIFAIVFLLSCQMISAQDILGKWITYDDETKKPKSEVEFYEKEGRYFAKIIMLYNLSEGVNPATAVCDKCKGDKKDKPLIGLNIVEDMVKKGDEYKEGKITDPKNGKSYNCSIKIDPKDPNTLIVKGSIGPFSRAQYWKRPE